MKIGSHLWNKVDFGQLYLSIQKNLVRGESIGHGLLGYSSACLTLTIQRIIARLHRWGATANTPLCANKEQAGTWKLIKSTNITTALRLSVEKMGNRYGLRKEDVSARSLRASGAMSLLLGGVDANTNKMPGR